MRKVRHCLGINFTGLPVTLSMHVLHALLQIVEHTMEARSSISWTSTLVNTLNNVLHLAHSVENVHNSHIVVDGCLATFFLLFWIEQLMDVASNQHRSVHHQNDFPSFLQNVIVCVRSRDIIKIHTRCIIHVWRCINDYESCYEITH